MEKNNRSAHHAIAGYYYQFDHTIAQIINLPTDLDSVTVEGIEDIDVHTATEKIAIQVKYYESSSYAIELVREPIVLMLEEFKKRRDEGRPALNYTLYAHFGEGWDRLEAILQPIAARPNEYRFTDIATHVLTGYNYQREANGDFSLDAAGHRIKIPYERHTELGLAAVDLGDFSIKIVKAVHNLEKQSEAVRAMLKEKFKCTTDLEADYYYNNSFAIVALLATKSQDVDRTIQKQEFSIKIDKKAFLFNKWYAALKSKDSYINYLRKKLKTGRALDIRKRKFFFIGKTFLTEPNREAAFLHLVKNIIAETYELDIAFSTKNKVSTLVLDVDQATLEQLKKVLDKNRIHFNDGNEHRTFSASRFNEEPIVNTTKVDRISKASYQIKIISSETFTTNWEGASADKIKPIDVIVYFSEDDENKYFSKVSEEFDIYVIPPSSKFSNLADIGDLFHKLIVNDDYFKVITVLPDLIQVEVTNPNKFAMKNDSFGMGSYMKITDENQVSIIGILQSYKIKDLNPEGMEGPTLEKKDPSFILDIQPVGLMENGIFVRGGSRITIPPSEVEVADEHLLKGIFKFPISKEEDKNKVFSFGTLSNYVTKDNQLLSVEMDGNKFFNKHIAVVGSTGSGKSCTVAKILQEGTRANYTPQQKSGAVLNNSHILIFDLHNEYSSAFPECRHLSVKELRLPYWLMNSEELQAFLLGNDAEDGFKKMVLKHVIVENKKKHSPAEKQDQVTYDMPVYFDLREVRRYLRNLNESKKERAGVIVKWKLNVADAATEEFADAFQEDQQITINNGTTTRTFPSTEYLFKYDCVSEGSQSDYHGEFTKILTRLDKQITDERLDFLFKKCFDIRTSDLLNIIRQFIGQEVKDQNDTVLFPKTNVTLIDLSGMPFEVLNITVALVSRLVFSFAYHWKKVNDLTTGTPIIKNPFLLVYEEAHNYIPKVEESKYRSVREAVERIAKEGRKYGLSAMIISQRPSELSETILSQCNSFVIMRVTNPSDQAYVKRLMPDSLSGVTDNLSVLQPREALLIGDAIPVPTMIKVNEIEKDRLPKSNDVPFIEQWRLDWNNMTEMQQVITSMTEK
jgi:flagellar biosynthesis GTPase FlhF